MIIRLPPRSSRRSRTSRATPPELQARHAEPRAAAGRGDRRRRPQPSRLRMPPAGRRLRLPLASRAGGRLYHRRPAWRWRRCATSERAEGRRTPAAAARPWGFFRTILRATWPRSTPAGRRALALMRHRSLQVGREHRRPADRRCSSTADRGAAGGGEIYDTQFYARGEFCSPRVQDASASPRRPAPRRSAPADGPAERRLRLKAERLTSVSARPGFSTAPVQPATAGGDRQRASQGVADA